MSESRYYNLVRLVEVKIAVRDHIDEEIRGLLADVGAAALEAANGSTPLPISVKRPRGRPRKARA